MFLSLVSFARSANKAATTKLCNTETPMAIMNYKAPDKLCDNYERKEIKKTWQKVYHLKLSVKETLVQSCYICADWGR